MKRLPFPPDDAPPLDAQGIYDFIERYLPGEQGDKLFWMLAGKRTVETWTWFAAQSAAPSFDAFWHGETDSVHSWEVEKYHLKTVQDTLRGENLLPGLLQIVREPLQLTMAVEIYLSRGDLPSLSKLWYIVFADGRLEGNRQALRELGALIIGEETLPELVTAGLMSEVFNIRLFVTSLGLRPIFLLESGLQNGDHPTKFWTSEMWWQPMIWDTAALRLAWMMGDATPLVRWLTPVQPSIAYRCATETGATCDADALEALLNPPTGARVSPEARAEWGRRAAVEGDARPSLGLRADGLPDIQWAKVPAGRFQVGGDPQAYNAWAGMEASLDYPFWMDSYLTTYAQYALFLAHYGERDYWTAAGWEWKGDQRQLPDYWDDPVFHLANHPVLGVSWYESVAFANWLNAVLPPDALPAQRDGYIVRLATEAEWEKAARSPDGRAFPSGNTYVPSSANVNETSARQEYVRTRADDRGVYYLKRTTAVGLYPPNPLGIYDLSGNVWEWCLSAWQESGVFPEMNSVQGTMERVLRGGSWNYSPDHARGASRMGYIAEGRGGAGIRLVYAPRI